MNPACPQCPKDSVPRSEYKTLSTRLEAVIEDFWEAYGKLEAAEAELEQTEIEYSAQCGQLNELRTECQAQDARLNSLELANYDLAGKLEASETERKALRSFVESVVWACPIQTWVKLANDVLAPFPSPSEAEEEEPKTELKNYPREPYPRPKPLAADSWCTCERLGPKNCRRHPAQSPSYEELRNFVEDLSKAKNDPYYWPHWYARAKWLANPAERIRQAKINTLKAELKELEKPC